MLERLKRTVRVAEATLTPRRSTVRFAGRELRFVQSMWWHDAHQASFDEEIAPYFAVLPADCRVTRICDAGAATGLFSIAACARFGRIQSHAFEPSRRQRILLRRNLSLNRVEEQVEVVSSGLWNESGLMAFRTHGAIGAFRAATSLPETLPFEERVSVTTLDDWVRTTGMSGIDLIKMDIEGAEIEALEGGVNLIKRDRPQMLVQAYHLRDGQRTFERCAAFLRDLGYTVRESGPPGLLHAHVS
jgi:FkbM family methyltransferase